MRRTSTPDLTAAELVSKYLELLRSGLAVEPEEFCLREEAAHGDVLRLIRVCKDIWNHRQEYVGLADERDTRLYERFLEVVDIKDKRAALRMAIERDRGEVSIDRRVDVLLLFLGLAREIWGSTRLIKLLFLIGKEAKLPSKIGDYYSYAPYTYGPFTAQVYKDIEYLSRYELVQKLKPSGSVGIHENKLERNEIDAVYILTEKGTKLTGALLRFAQKKEPDLLKALIRIRDRYARLPLRRLLQYVYKTYPEYTRESQIRDAILRDIKDGKE